MKKKVFACALIAACLSIVAYGTTAYFTYEDTATNVIVAGNIKIELQEWAIPAWDGPPVPFEDAVDVLPGTDVSKIVQVKNVGNHPAWIRISLASSVFLKDGSYGWIDPSLIYLDLNKDFWVEWNGYYYYTAPLLPGETTLPLFTKVYFSPYLGDTYQESKFIIDVTAQATQVAHNGNTVFEAVGWPGTNGGME